MQGYAPGMTINREVGSAGWFVTKNIMIKTEYVNQVYLNYAATHILNGGKFDGMVFESSIGF
jgi:hypothetical protein